MCSAVPSDVVLHCISGALHMSLWLFFAIQTSKNDSSRSYSWSCMSKRNRNATQIAGHQEKTIFNIVLHSSDSTFSSVDDPPVY
jgi:hypothetical protein